MNLYESLKKPEPYAPSPSIWTHEHIASMMLKAHLSDENDAASYVSARREKIGAYLYEAMDLVPGKRLLDLGCGPGLYAQWFEKKGLRVTGVDFSSSSIAYAREQAKKEGLSIDYILSDYREDFPAGGQDAAMMISEDYGVLGEAGRASLLSKVFGLLGPGGYLALDVCADAVWKELDESARWSLSESGFFCPRRHVLLEKRYLYENERAFCDLYAVLEEELSVYYVYQTLFTVERITEELAKAGFYVRRILGNLDGAPYSREGRQIGLIAQKEA